ncbi:MAG TPA: hypothetical protein VGR95_11525 [Thermoanaerobaculia bacterium]|nr:hypothetical protein [Thermoanaerobaculia bacterium]
MTDPGVLKLTDASAFGIELLIVIDVGEKFVLFAESPEAHPGNPPVGDQRPAVVVQFAFGGGALEVTL